MAMRYYCIFKSRNAHVCVVLALLGACTVPRPCRSRANRALLLSPALSAWNLTLGNGSGLSDSVAPNEQRYRSATIKKTSPASRSSHIPIRLPNCKLITAAGAAEQQPLPSFANLQSVRKLLASSCSGQYSQGYTVQPGDFLSKIAASCSLSLLQLESANSQITDPNLIHPGDTVCVPSTCSIGRRLLYSHDLKTAAHSSTFARQLAESPCSGQYAKAYSVRQGDILNTIASACNKVALAQLNQPSAQLQQTLHQAASALIKAIQAPTQFRLEMLCPPSPLPASGTSPQQGGTAPVTLPAPSPSPAPSPPSPKSSAGQIWASISGIGGFGAVAGFCAWAYITWQHRQERQLLLDSITKHGQLSSADGTCPSRERARQPSKLNGGLGDGHSRFHKRRGVR
ncbi:hypothetical protein WJX79_005132 [Trebouxia sp. C0005]